MFKVTNKDTRIMPADWQRGNVTNQLAEANWHKITSTLHFRSLKYIMGFLKEKQYCQYQQIPTLLAFQNTYTSNQRKNTMDRYNQEHTTWNQATIKILVLFFSIFFYLGFLSQPSPHYNFHPLHRHLDISLVSSLIKSNPNRK